MNRNPLLTHYISEIDQFLQELEQKNPQLSLSQLKERAKDFRQVTERSEAPHEKDI